jgi:hypothetical protein
MKRERKDKKYYNLATHCNQNGIKMKSKWNQNEIKLATHCNQNGIKLESKWNQNGIKLESKWNQIGIKLESKWNQIGYTIQKLILVNKIVYKLLIILCKIECNIIFDYYLSL